MMLKILVTTISVLACVHGLQSDSSKIHSVAVAPPRNFMSKYSKPTISDEQKYYNQYQNAFYKDSLRDQKLFGFIDSTTSETVRDNKIYNQQLDLLSNGVNSYKSLNRDKRPKYSKIQRSLTNIPTLNYSHRPKYSSLNRGKSTNEKVHKKHLIEKVIDTSQYDDHEYEYDSDINDVIKKKLSKSKYPVNSISQKLLLQKKLNSKHKSVNEYNEKSHDMNNHEKLLEALNYDHEHKHIGDFDISEVINKKLGKRPRKSYKPMFLTDKNVRRALYEKTYYDYELYDDDDDKHDSEIDSDRITSHKLHNPKLKAEDRKDTKSNLNLISERKKKPMKKIVIRRFKKTSNKSKKNSKTSKLNQLAKFLKSSKLTPAEFYYLSKLNIFINPIILFYVP